jgi:hypothetical protein
MLSTLNVNDLFSGDGSNRDWTYPFQILTSDGSDIQIWLTSPLGVVSQVTASYSINTTTKVVTYPTVASLMDPLETGWTIELRRVTPKTQGLDLIQGGSFTANALEGAIDKCTAITQEIKAQLNDIVTANTTPTQLAILISELNDLVATATTLSEAASDAKDAAAVSAAEAVISAAAALLSETNAAASEAAALAAVPTIGAGDGYKVLQAKSDETGYELTSGNVAHRPIILNSSAQIPPLDGSLINNLQTFPPTVFDVFAGNGEDGDAIINADANFSVIDSAIAGRAQFSTLTVAATKTLTIDTGIAIIGVSGTLTIHGTISAVGKGNAGGLKNVGVDAFGNQVTALSAMTNKAGILTGGGGGGGGGNDAAGRAGGWAGSVGGAGGAIGANDGVDATARDATREAQIVSLGFPSAALLYCGAGGGGGGGGGGGETIARTGGAGGGIIYIECNELVYDGVLTADGANGENGATGNVGGAGGGGGGLIVVRAKTITTNTGTTSANGGVGGSDPGGGLEGAGGDGADGYTVILTVA